MPVDLTKWTFPPFSGTRNGGYVYGRGAIDDKSHVVAALMVVLTLKRLGLPLDRDVIFLAEAGEENTTSIGMEFMVEQHLPEIAAQYCFAEGGYVRRIGGQVKFASVETLEKIQKTVELTARGAAGHGSIPLPTNAVVHLARAIAALAAWHPPIRLNETTSTYFERLAGIVSPEEAARYRSLRGSDPAAAAAAARYMVDHEPIHASMLWPSVSPTMVTGGYRVNVIPSEAKATLDVRLLPDDDAGEVLAALRKVVDDPAIEVVYGKRDSVPVASADLETEAFSAIEAAVTKHYQTVTLPTMSTATTDMPYIRSRGTQCYGIGPALDWEDAAKGFGPHSDQERILETELHRFIRFEWDIVAGLSKTRASP
ncbi:MAG: M20/M25/M40 family metallo-hydrolase [Gemmatimonadota bacterium]